MSVRTENIEKAPTFVQSEGYGDLIEEFKEKIFENEAHEDVQTLIDTNAEKIEDILTILREE